MLDSINKGLKQIYDKFSKSTKPIQRAFIESVHSLVNLAEKKDPHTKRHAIKVSNNAVLIAKAIGMSKKEIETLRLAAILHDIGKIGIRDKILLKASSLSEEEYEEVKKHSEIGAEIARPLKLFTEVILMVKHHHENYDGTGYPDGLKKEKIPIGSRILSIADVYDALTSKRAYRDAYSAKKALEIMKEESGKKFDPYLFDVFIKCISSKHKEKKRSTSRVRSKS